MSVLIFEGMKVGFLDGDAVISIDEDGKTSSKLILSTSYNTLPIWLRLAFDNCELAKDANQTLTSNWPTDTEDQKENLLAELRPSMLAIVACAVAIDALYDLVKPLAKLDPDTLRGWTKNKKSRAFQITEVFRRAFKLDREETQRCKKIVTEIFGLRDPALHPSHKIKRSMQRPDIPVGTDWRFAAYRYTNAQTAFDNTIRMVKTFLDRSEHEKKLYDEMSTVSKSLLENGIDISKF